MLPDELVFYVCHMNSTKPMLHHCGVTLSEQYVQSIVYCV